ncbi:MULTISPECIES: NAD(P)/FAD-dependent oxidoreductase [unclassified Micromonospora]|uniref:FAD-dependent oxidoreductase n=1 Tax=unclassified Micromonospora TaxID=2617518 RepID=UPI001034409A|nr:MULTISPECIES: NAD(P)/FAD-dependent oxidoreductase [unclassified Micromonospora]QKW14945.1 FAD-dependent monooxygenase [Verrucosispora sp. NA02020]TBL29055.1 FAD-dependent monooxygenase [Verrucosispora sp. SN26_14.1]
MSTRTPHVLVIGAGTGGLCLAHGLRRAGISVAVYERHRTRADGLLGYRVGIGPTGSRALRDCLPPELFRIYLATCARSPRYFNVLTQRMRHTASFPLRPDTDPVDTERSVARMTLRQVLLTGMEDVVHFDRTFTHYDQHDDGTVTAYFADGTSAVGDLLVAADGTHSAVRRQYLPHATVRDAGTVNIATRIPLTAHTRGLLPETVRRGISLIFGTGGVMGVLHVMEFKWDGDGRLKPDVPPADAALLADWPGLRHDPTRDNINLVVWSTARRFPADVLRRRGGELIQVALELTANWHPTLRELLSRADPESALPIRVSTSEPVPPWKSSTVTLLGDAIHTMTPGRGVGANTALRDANLLRRHLVSAVAGEKTLVQAVADYEATMLPYGFARVADSLNRSGTSGDDRMYKPVFGRLALLGARGYFRVTSRVPPLRRKFVDDFYTYRGEED